MNTIPSSFTERGFDHREIARSGAWRVYVRSRRGRSHWEVVRIRVAKPWECHGALIPEREVYPASEKWGVDGFTFTTEGAALAKLATFA